jgi:hypothetical protein
MHFRSGSLLCAIHMLKVLALQGCFLCDDGAKNPTPLKENHPGENGMETFRYILPHLMHSFYLTL